MRTPDSIRRILSRSFRLLLSVPSKFFVSSVHSVLLSELVWLNLLVEMEKMTLKFFVCLNYESPEKVMQKCSDLGLIASKYVCPVCGKGMSLRARPKKIDKLEWICRTKSAPSHSVTRSIRSGSYFEKSKLSIPDILLLTHLILLRVEQRVIMDELNITSHTVCDWYSFIREICVEECLKMNQPIGGPGKVVEIKECKFGRRKFNHGKRAEDDWVFGGVERGSRKCFFKVVDRCDKDTLLATIKTSLLPGTTVYSDCWKSYDCLADEGFRLLTANQSLRFKDFETEVSKNSEECTWSAIKRALPNRTVRDQFDSYLAEYFWRRAHADTDNLTKAFLKAAAKLCPPRTFDIGPAEAEPEEEEETAESDGPT